MYKDAVVQYFLLGGLYESGYFSVKKTKSGEKKMGEKQTNQEKCWTGCGRRVNVAGRLECWPRRMGGRVFDRPATSGSIDGYHYD